MCQSGVLLLRGHRIPPKSQHTARHRRLDGARELELSRPRDRAMHAGGRFAPLSKEPEVMIWPGITHRRIDDREEGTGEHNNANALNADMSSLCKYTYPPAYGGRPYLAWRFLCTDAWAQPAGCDGVSATCTTFLSILIPRRGDVLKPRFVLAVRLRSTARLLRVSP